MADDLSRKERIVKTRYQGGFGVCETAFHLVLCNFSKIYSHNMFLTFLELVLLS